MSKTRVQGIDARTLIITATILFVGMLLAVVASVAIMGSIMQSQMSAFAAQQNSFAYTPASSTRSYAPAAPASVSQTGGDTNNCVAAQAGEPKTSTPVVKTVAAPVHKHTTSSQSVKKLLGYSMNVTKIGSITTNNTTTTTNISNINSNNTIGSFNSKSSTKTKTTTIISGSFNKNSFNKDSQNVASSINSDNGSGNLTDNSTNTTTNVDVNANVTLNSNSNNTGSNVNSHNGSEDNSTTTTNNTTNDTTTTNNDIDTNINSNNNVDVTNDSNNTQLGAFQNI